MEGRLKKTTLFGFIFIMLVGTLLHFTFHWSGQNPVAGLFSAVNESTWEHMKILFVPSLIFFLIEHKKYGPSAENLLMARTLGLLCGTAFIPIAYYTCTGVIGKSFLWLDIVLFAAAILLTFYFSRRFLRARIRLTSLAALLILFTVLAIFFLLTFFPPHIALFLDPQTFSYGIHIPQK